MAKKLEITLGLLFLAAWMWLTISSVFDLYSEWNAKRAYHAQEFLPPRPAADEEAERADYRNAILYYSLGGLAFAFVPYYLGVGSVKFGKRIYLAIKRVKDGAAGD